MLNTQNNINTENKQNYLTHRIEEAGVLVKVGEKYFTKLDGVYTKERGKANIIFYDGHPSSGGKMLTGFVPMISYTFYKIDCTAYNGLYCIVEAEKFGNYTVFYS